MQIFASAKKTRTTGSTIFFFLILMVTGVAWAEDVEHRTMRIDGVLQALDVCLAGRAVDDHVGGNVRISRPRRVIDGEEAAKIDVAGHLYDDSTHRNAEQIRVQPVGDLLASPERRQNQLDGIRTLIGSAQ